MTVAELIEHLKTLPQDATVWARDFETGMEVVEADDLKLEYDGTEVWVLP